MAREDATARHSPGSPDREQLTETDESTTPSVSPPPFFSKNEEEEVDDEKRKHRNRVAERKSRLSRKAQRERMATQVHALECVLANIMFVGDDAAESIAGWSELFLDDDESKRVRDFLRRIIPLEAEKARLASEQSELRRLMRERVVVDDLLRDLLAEINKEDKWEWRVMRWRALTRASFDPWSKAKCDAMVKDTLASMGGFMAKDGVVTTGLSFLGWRDRRRHDKETGKIEFSFYKTSYGNTDVHNERLWSLHRDVDAYAEIIVGPHVCTYAEIIQEIDDNACLVRSVEQYPDSPAIVHMVQLLFRHFVGDACYIVRRSVPVPEVQAALSDPNDIWACNFYWTSHLVLDRNASGVCTKYLCSTFGTLSSDAEAYAVRWLSEVLFSVVRAENWIRGTQLLLE